ncbi:MAG: BMP family ABC transporter substrate-binding protein [Coprococcus sp.]
MSANEYMKAQKLGEKRYQAAVLKNEYPYLPVLDDMISTADIECEVNLGLQNVPLDHVVGTATSARTTAFASNFMPILDLKTEFGSKWSALCDSHIEEGIHDPIKAYEYMNKYYVIEGNKRVSVLKYFGADSVPAVVIRKVPKKNDTIENKVYFEYIDFHKQTGINYILFSQPGSYDKLREYIGLVPGETFSEDARMDFNSARLSFEKAFRAKKGGDSLTITQDDALLVFLSVYGYTALKEMTGDEVKESVDKIWDEILLSSHKKENVVLPKLDPVESKKKLFTKKPDPSKKLKIAFVYDKDPENSVWIYSHELGRLKIEEIYKDKISTTTCCHIDNNEKLAECLNELAEEDYDVIFTTGPEMLPESLRVAVEYPDIKILNCSLNMSTSHVRTYYARMYEAKFITGIVAGCLCTNDRIGYVADYPIFGTVSNINAFAIGAKLVNPRAKIYVEWTKMRGANPKERFKELGISYISDRDMISPLEASREFGLHCNENGEIRNLAMPFHNWGAFYERIVKTILDGNWKQEEKNETAKSVNYWWGMSAGVIDVICSKHLPIGTMRLVNLMKKMIKEGSVTPFYGKLYSQQGVVRDDADGEMLPEDIIKMDWLAENVVGYIPDMSELIDDAIDVVNLQGVNSPSDLALKS